MHKVNCSGIGEVNTGESRSGVSSYLLEKASSDVEFLLRTEDGRDGSL